MTKRTIFAVIVILSVLSSQFFLVPQVAAGATACDAALFVADVTVPDGSAFSPNAAFTKTWRLKNVGSCTWTTSYKLVYVSGNQMGGPSELALPGSVAPNSLLDLSINLTAPVPPGTYRGYWQLKNASGVSFGIGATADHPIWVDIVTRPGSAVTPMPVGESYNFALQAARAQSWMSGAGLLSFPGTDGDPNGFAQKLDSVKTETGATVNLPTLLMVPQNKTDGYIQGLFPSLAIQNGDHFQTTIGCQYGASACYVTYRIDYRTSTGARTLWSARERNEGLTYNVNIDLSFLAGQNVEFFLLVLASGSPAGDRALWLDPRIVHTTVISTPVPSPTPRLVDASIDVDLPAAAVCGTPNPVTIRATVTSMLATTVTYHWEMVDTKTVVTPDQTLTFSAAGTQAVNPGPYTVDCGPNFTARIVITAPYYWSAMIYYSIIPTGPTLTPPGNGTPTATITSAPVSSCDRATFVTDITVPDGTVFAPNTPFTKIWRLMNTGTCTWNTSYTLVYSSGDQMDGPAETALNAVVAPNTSTDISLNLTSPAGPGIYRGYWMLKNGSGQLFGIGPTGTQPFWVGIQEVGPTLTPTPTPNGGGQTPSPTLPASPGPTLTPTPTPLHGNWLIYNNAKYQFHFQYPPDAQQSDPQDNSVRIDLPFAPGTNLGEKFLQMAAVENASSCSALPTSGLPVSTSEQLTINGIVFTKQTGQDQGMSQIREWTNYFTVKGNVCVSMGFMLHSAVIGVLPTGTPEFNHDLEAAVFGQIMSTFAWNNP